ncbi:PDZ and LIM domain protein Zasp isoform X4 [Drosophila kikkawai]|uniref:PDZ and LIM domain protein Zasp isoform X4 n=1 Tax=Drosophila kikkawai TaxID=30033 RepID=A0A6P4IW27_DROKI|nr:PDZ and LIM domain protein Zasp isoform X5 [Drosophila kikkawai]
MAQPQLLQVKLSRFDAQPWGFRLQGGTDFAQPLLVQKVNAGSLSEQAGLQPGDAVIKINDVDVFNLRHKDAQDIVVRSGNNFVITVQRGGSTWRPHVTPTGNVPQPNSPYLQTVTKTSLAHQQQDSQHIGCGYNNAARPFTNGGDGGVKSIVNKQYNTPVGIYSDESIAETLSAQAEVLAGGVLGVNFKKNEKEYQGDRSEVLKFLREEETGQSTPEPHSPANFYWTQSHAIGGNERRTPLHHQPDERIGVPLQSNTLAPAAPHRPSLPVAPKDKEEQPRQDQEQPDPRIIVLPICPGLQGPEYKAEMEAAAAALASGQDGRPRPLSASGHPACQLCGVGIVGVFVRIKDKNLHVECFKCATCGTSLKNQGYYNFNNKLYCDIHAKQAAINNPPAGTEGYVPVPIKPNTKLSANTISSALNSHGYGGGSNGYSNGNSTPAPAPPEPETSQELPLPPPPSPTQLLQYEAEELLQQPPAPEQQLPSAQLQQQQQQPEQHTRTHSSLSSISSGSSSSGVGGSGSGSGVGQSQQSYCSTLSLDRFGSPQHSRQTSASSTSLEVVAAPTTAAAVAPGQGDNYTMPPSPPPPPPPANAVTNYRLQATQQQQLQNENDMNMQNKGHNAYNQLLKEYSNKLQHQQQQPNKQHTHQHTTNTPPTLRHNNNTAKPFAASQQHQQQPLVAALTATLANQLKFNPHQVASPQATVTATATAVAAAATPAPVAAPLTATDSSAAAATATTVATSDIMSANVADEPSSIYGQINTNPAPSAPGGGDQPFEYVTLTGNVIRSVQAPGKGAAPGYKVNQGYARPFGAAAPKSPVSYPPQQQQQSPRPAPGGQNPYATLPRSNAGQQGRNVRYQQQQQQQQQQYSTQQQKQQYRNSYPMGSNYSTPSQSPYITSYNTNNNNFNNNNNNYSTYNNNNSVYRGAGGKSGGVFGATSAPKRGRGILNKAAGPGVRIPLCNSCNVQIRGPFITALGKIWCPDHFICVNGNCRRPLQDIGFVEEKGDLYCEYCFEKYLAPTCSKCAGKIKGDCLNAIGKHFHPECFTCGQCGKIFGNTPFFLEDGNAYCEADWNELFTTKCFACGFPVEAGDRWVEALNHNYHSQCFNCTFCKQNLEGQSFYNKGGRPFCKNHAR